MSGSLFGPAFNAPEMAEALSDERYVRLMVEVEVALAEAQASLGVIPKDAAEEIARKANNWVPAKLVLRQSTEKNGVPVAGLVREFRAHVGGRASEWIHWGATSQDILDTALVLQLQDALALLEAVLREVCAHLARLAAEHRETVMTGRTLGQAALPTTFGARAAGWLASLMGNLDRLTELRPRLLVVQLGGAVGTLAALGDDGPAVEAEFASRLDLTAGPCSWHTRRESMAELAGWLCLVTSGLGKIGQDVILLAQTEIDEVRETGEMDQGVSSTMPHKRNPVLSPRLVAAARYNAGLLGTVHHAMLHEHERGTHGWALERLALTPMLHTAAGALRNARTLAESLAVQKQTMADNLVRTRGALLAEAAMFRLALDLGRAEATTRVRSASAQSREGSEHLVDILERTETAEVDWSQLRDEAAYLGSADAGVARVLEEAAARGIETTTADE